MYRPIEESQTLLINTQSQLLETSGKKIIRFGFGQSPFLPPKKVIKALQYSANRKEYSSVQGHYDLRFNISKFHAQHNGLLSSENEILVAPGSKILIYNTLLSYAKADVLIPSPAWVSYAPQARLVGHHVIEIKTSYKEKWRVTPKNLQESIRKKKTKNIILIINLPGNPDGLTYDDQQLFELAEICKKNGILVISDEIYGLLKYTGLQSSFAYYYPEKTITTTGLSKWCGAGGWRLGAAVLSPGIDTELKKTILGIGSETYSCAPTPVQAAAVEAYSDYFEMKAYLKYQVEILNKVSHYVYKNLVEAGVKLHQSEGGFYAFIDFSLFNKKLQKKGLWTSNELCQDLLQKTGVALLPASAFGFSPTYYAARLAFVDFEEPSMNEDFVLYKNGKQIINGIELMKQYLVAL